MSARFWRDVAAESLDAAILDGELPDSMLDIASPPWEISLSFQSGDHAGGAGFVMPPGLRREMSATLPFPGRALRMFGFCGRNAVFDLSSLLAAQSSFFSSFSRIVEDMAVSSCFKPRFEEGHELFGPCGRVEQAMVSETVNAAAGGRLDGKLPHSVFLTPRRLSLRLHPDSVNADPMLLISTINSLLSGAGLIPGRGWPAETGIPSWRRTGTDGLCAIVSLSNSRGSAGSHFSFAVADKGWRRLRSAVPALKSLPQQMLGQAVSMSPLMSACDASSGRWTWSPAYGDGRAASPKRAKEMSESDKLFPLIGFHMNGVDPGRAERALKSVFGGEMKLLPMGPSPDAEAVGSFHWSAFDFAEARRERRSIGRAAAPAVSREHAPRRV